MSSEEPLTADQWLKLAPQPRPLDEEKGQKWHVFLSYRSTYRPWVLQLYDVLRHLGFEVFLDQYVLLPTKALAGSLAEGLDRSASGVIVWSGAFADSEWCLEELNAMISKRNSDKSFNYVISTLNSADRLPALAKNKLYIDFSEFREGPRGAGLLKLLYGLLGQAPPDAVVKLATQVDEETTKTLAQIKAYEEIGEPDKLLGLAETETPAWVTSPLLGSNVAESLISLAEYDKALAVIRQLKGQFPKAIRPRQLEGLALARQKKRAEAQEVLAELYAEGERDPETLGLYARTWKDRWVESQNPLHLRKARDLYVEAFEGSASDYYTGINAASMSVLLGELDEAETYAARVEEIVGTGPAHDDYWKTATAAEVQLDRQHYDQAAELYDAAVAMTPEALGDHGSTWKQAQLLMEKLDPPDDDREKIARAFAHLKN
jgi:tetratricopeptide (TPR) repeat protein